MSQSTKITIKAKRVFLLIAFSLYFFNAKLMLRNYVRACICHFLNRVILRIIFISSNIKVINSSCFNINCQGYFHTLIFDSFKYDYHLQATDGLQLIFFVHILRSFCKALKVFGQFQELRRKFPKYLRTHVHRVLELRELLQSFHKGRKTTLSSDAQLIPLI